MWVVAGSLVPPPPDEEICHVEGSGSPSAQMRARHDMLVPTQPVTSQRMRYQEPLVKVHETEGPPGAPKRLDAAFSSNHIDPSVVMPMKAAPPAVPRMSRTRVVIVQSALFHGPPLLVISRAS